MSCSQFLNRFCRTPLLGAIAVFALAACATTSPPAAQPPQLVDAGTLASRAVWVEVMLDGRVVTKGVGSWVRPGIVATAMHVVDEVPASGSVRVRNLLGHAPALRYVPGDRNGMDGALLRVDDLQALGRAATLPPVIICSDPLKPASPVWVVSPTMATLAHGSPDRVQYSRDGVSTNELTIFSEPGDSGSGVYDATTGCLAGVVSQQSTDHLSVSGTSRQFFTTKITPADQVQSLIDIIPASPASGS